MQDRGQEIIVSLYMENTLYPDSPSRNLWIDLVGSEKPDEYGNNNYNNNNLYLLLILK